MVSLKISASILLFMAVAVSGVKIGSNRIGYVECGAAHHCRSVTCDGPHNTVETDGYDCYRGGFCRTKNVSSKSITCKAKCEYDGWGLNGICPNLTYWSPEDIYKIIHGD
ncbi:hypothetical protein BCR32DRAFT_297949 [Anaeromyces robustus]|uniref:Uncharacterized protein n=1 Tax=Anaeromyces robustus TaxID=1754192 RepID=A0A1Y1VUR0_9FUNG|nr:hypothetical protein BCR32DRAFT_297949 [Anaeromyces robustus]|eukprot:ORX64755.1 hypothetical protein BCR32DRAFT_297949 [Anaeromyces robustus]